MASKSSSGDTSHIDKWTLTNFWIDNQYWREETIYSIDCGKIITGESKRYTEKGKEYLDKFLENKIKNEKSIHRLWATGW